MVVRAEPVNRFSRPASFRHPRYVHNWDRCGKSKGVAKWGSWRACDHPFVSLFWANKLQQVAKRHENLVSTLIFDTVWPPFEKFWLRSWKANINVT